MVYCDIDDIKNQFSEKAMIQYSREDSAETKAVYEGRVSKAIEAASSEIDGYLIQAGLFPLNSSAIPGYIKKSCVDISIFNIVSRKGFDPEKANEKVLLERYKQATIFLKSLIENQEKTGSKGMKVSSPQKVFKKALWK